MENGGCGKKTKAYKMIRIASPPTGGEAMTEIQGSSPPWRGGGWVKKFKEL
jgi:hypothetical protein